MSLYKRVMHIKKWSFFGPPCILQRHHRRLLSRSALFCAMPVKDVSVYVSYTSFAIEYVMWTADIIKCWSSCANWVHRDCVRYRRSSINVFRKTQISTNVSQGLTPSNICVSRAEQAVWAVEIIPYQ